MRVLVVSEDAAERTRAVSALALLPDVEVVEAPGAEEARWRVLHEDEHFDVLVVDGDLRPRGGFAMLYDLRARCELEGREAAPALVMASREQDRWLARWAGASDVLLKPVDSFELARRVATLEGTEIPPYGDASATARQVASMVPSPRQAS